MIVKRCNGKDIEKIYEIEEKSFSDPLKKETMSRDMERESYCCYGLYDGDLVAFISYERVIDEAQIISVAVHPDYRRRGYAKELFSSVYDAAKNDGIKVFSLEVRSENTPAVRLYEGLGFKAVGVRKNYYTNPVCDAILMDLIVRED